VSAWKLCNSRASADYIPCLDNLEAIRKLKTDKHYEHRERHCPAEAPTCLVPAPPGPARVSGADPVATRSGTATCRTPSWWHTRGTRTG